MAPACDRRRELDRRRAGRIRGRVPEARALVELYAAKGVCKYERAALRYLMRHMEEAIAQVAAVLAEGGMRVRAL
jgi:hypothetical protein